MSPPGTRAVSGTVFEVTSDGRQPVQDAWVGFEALIDTVVAETTTDASGRYSLCGLPRERFYGLFAVKPGYTAPSPLVEAGGDVVVDIEITRR